MRRNLFFLGMFLGGLGKAAKEGMGNVGLGSELGMELACDKPRVIGDLYDFDKISLGVNTADFKTKLFKCSSMRIIKFIPMPMAFLDGRRGVGLLGS